MARIKTHTKCSHAIVRDVHHAAVVVHHQERARQAAGAPAHVLTDPVQTLAGVVVVVVGVS